MAQPTEDYFSTRYDQLHPSPQHIGKEVLIAAEDETHLGILETVGMLNRGPREFGIRIGRTYNPDGTILGNGRIFNTDTSLFNMYELSNINSNEDEHVFLSILRRQDRGGKKYKQKTKQKKTKRKSRKLFIKSKNIKF